MTHRPRCSSLLLGAVFLLISATPESATADSLSSTYGAPLVEVAHQVTFDVHLDHVTFVVRRAFTNVGSLPDEASVRIDLPHKGVVTGLRVLAGPEPGSGEWIEGALLPRSDAATLYDQLLHLDTPSAATSLEPVSPVLVTWAGVEAVELSLYPVEPGRTSVVEYTVTAPLLYRDGRYLTRYPYASPDEDNVVAPVLTVANRVGLDVRVDGRALSPGVALPLTRGAEPESIGDSESGPVLEIAPPPFRTLASRFARVPLGGRRALVRLDLDAAPEISPVPRDLSVVFVVDASYSMKADGIDAQLDRIEAFLSHVPDARFEIVTYRREAARLAGELAPAVMFGTMRSLWELGGRFERANGSALEKGIRLAAEALHGVTGPSMIVAFNDDALRDRFSPLEAIAAVAPAPPGTTLHLVLTPRNRSYGSALERDDEVALAEVARSSGGMLVYAGRTVDASPAELAAEVLRLVRPTSIDRLRIAGLPVSGADRGSLELGSLVEGSAERRVFVMQDAPAKLVVYGELWSRPFERELHADEAFGLVAAALVFGETDAFEALRAADARRLAEVGGAVSPLTSYLAHDPDALPEVVERDGLFGMGGMSGGGSFSCSCGGGLHGAVSPHFEAPSLSALLNEEITACVAAHADAESWSLTLNVETTHSEVVDVWASDPTDSALAECIMEAAWASPIPAMEHWDHRVLSEALSSPG